ncbi:MAG: Rrf2 family transcriptional regulator [Candidatus Aminicenantes bacterium]|jgi:Rrf2 family protein|nr:Rrf2 family transcriptional regulator [Candidatus Aminicenantes bacterium]
MIKLSTKGRYGTRLMLNLAHHYKNGNESVILKSVSDKEEISIRYLEQIVIPLKINKLVKSIRGAGGGYTLGRHPSKIKLIEILHSLEGSCCLVDCVEDEDYCDRTLICATYDIWEKASKLLKDYFGSITLQDLIEISNKKNSKAKAKSKTKNL